MKKTSILAAASVALLLLGSGAVSNAKHMVLYEKFTNTGCGPCARFAPGSDSLINMRLGEMVSVTYHGTYPYPNDPFYLDTKEKGADNRLAQYDISGYPSAILDGTQVNHSVSNIEKHLDLLIAEPQTVDLSLSSSFVDGVVSSKAVVKPIADIEAADLRLFVAVMEEEVHLAKEAPNGQTDFHYEFKSFMHDPAGIPVARLQSGGAEQSFDVSWNVVMHTDNSLTIQGVDNTDQLAVVAWVQDVATGKVYEAAYAPRDSSYPDMARVLLVKDTPQSICMPQYSAKIKFRNEGRNNMTSCNVCIRINGSVQKTPWTGDVSYLGTVELTTPLFEDFDLNPTATKNDVDIFISDINGTEAMSTIYKQSYKNAVCGENAVELTLYTDNKPEEISWTLKDENGNVVQTSAPYSTKRAMEKTTFNISRDGCYKLEFKDAGGDGIKGDYGNGWYKLASVSEAGKKTTLIQTDYDGAEHVVNFSVVNANPSGVDAIVGESSDEIIFTGTELVVGADGFLTICDANGTAHIAGSVRANQNVDLSDLNFGIYFVVLATKEATLTKSIIIR